MITAPLDFSSTTTLRAAGFTGFGRVADLRASRLATVPAQSGVYLVVRDSTSPPSFLSESPAGWFKGKNPTLPIAGLQVAWIPNACVVYIGKAGGVGTRATLRSRLAAYLRHGGGTRAAHWGGRAVWQLQDAPELLLAWQTLQSSPRDFERTLIAQFVVTYGQRPFANRAA
jgi:hypothetical protein